MLISRKKILLPLILVSSYSFSSVPTTKHSYLDQQIKNVIATNLTLSAYRHETLKQKYQVAIANSGYYPIVNVKLKAGYQKSTDPTQDSGFYEENGTSSEASFKQPLFNGYSTYDKVKLRGLILTNSEFEYQFQLNSMILDMLNTILAIKKDRQMIVASKDELKIFVQVYALSKAKHLVGKSERSALFLLNADESLARNELIAANTQLMADLNHYISITGHPYDNKVQFTINIRTLLPNSYIAYKHEVNSYNIDYKKVQNDEKMASVNIGISKAKFSPNFYLEGKAQRDFDYSGRLGEYDKYAADAVLTFNFFNGTKDYNTVYSAKQIYYKAQDKLKQLAIDMDNESANDWNQLSASIKAVNYLSMYSRNYKMVVSDYIQIYKAGRKTIFELLQAERDFNAGRNALINSRYKQKVQMLTMLSHVRDLQRINW